MRTFPMGIRFCDEVSHYASCRGDLGDSGFMTVTFSAVVVDGGTDRPFRATLHFAAIMVGSSRVLVMIFRRSMLYTLFGVLLRDQPDSHLS